MAIIMKDYGVLGENTKFYHATSIPSNGRVDLDFSPTHISVCSLGVGVSVYDEDTSITQFKQYWGNTSYTYDIAVGGTGHGFTKVDSGGFNWDTDYVGNVFEIYAY